MGSSISLFPPISALSFAPPGNGGIKLGLVDEVRAAVGAHPRAGPLPCPSLQWSLGCFIPLITRTQGTCRVQTSLSQKMTFFPLFTRWSKFFHFVLFWSKMLWVADVSHPLSFGAPMQKASLLVQVLFLLPANTHWMPVGKPAVAWTVLVASCFAAAALGLFKNDVDSLNLSWWWCMVIFLLQACGFLKKESLLHDESGGSAQGNCIY